MALINADAVRWRRKRGARVATTTKSLLLPFAEACDSCVTTTAAGNGDSEVAKSAGEAEQTTADEGKRLRQLPKEARKRTR